MKKCLHSYGPGNIFCPAMTSRRNTRPYESLQDWMERTNHTQTELREMVYERTGYRISGPHLSGVLTGRWRCSLEKAIALSKVTGVPVEKLVRWPRVAADKTSDTAA